ncbi:MAG: hypothetical protein KF850_00755 [Labilithrix sp.]|nr:hypothetical protein [Labilithrix sp.]
MLASRVKTWLSSPRFPAVAVLIACILSLPTLRTRLVADDLWHRAMMRNDARWLPVSGSPMTLFTFASGSPEEGARVLESGFAPWWTPPGLRLALFRPLASLTHALDYTLWPTSPWVMHAQSIAWYALVVWLAARLYRRWLGSISPLAAGIAALFYAIDHTHGLPVGWIANRNALIATAFSLAALLLHDAGARRARPGVLPFAAAASLGLALASGESAVATLAYLAAHALFLDERPVGARVRSLAPAAAIVGVWIAVYRAGDFGARGSGVYTDPAQAPLAFLGGLGAHVPLLLGAELGAPLPDAYAFASPAGKAVFIALALAVLAWASLVTLRMLRAGDARVRRASRFFASASVLAVVPSTATFPSGRLLFLAGFGLVALLAMTCAGAIERAPWAAAASGRPARVVRAYAAWTWLGHLVLAPFLFLLGAHSIVILDDVIRQLATGIPADGSARDKRIVLVNAPDTAFAYYLVITHLEDGGSPPERMLLMTGNRRDVRLSRTGEKSFVVHEDGGFYRTGTELLFRGLSPPLPAGTRVALSDVTITVTHTTDDGVPDEASFVFANDLETSYLFRQWQGKALVPFELPAVGETVRFPGRVPDLL